jgi:hypothetical protein
MTESLTFIGGFLVENVSSLENEVEYTVRHKIDRRVLTLYHLPGVEAALVTDEAGNALAAAFADESMNGEEHAKKYLLEFTGQEGYRADGVTRAALHPPTIAELPLPDSVAQNHWKNATSFLTAMPSVGEDNPIFMKELPTTTMRKMSLEEMFCSPPIPVQENSALDACSQSLCAYIRCVKQDLPCTDERQAVSASCFARG